MSQDCRLGKRRASAVTDDGMKLVARPFHWGLGMKRERHARNCSQQNISPFDVHSSAVARAESENRQSNHLITLSARASTFGGIVSPICLAVFRLMMKSNFVGRSTGISPALVPLRILSTTRAACRAISESFAP